MDFMPLLKARVGLPGSAPIPERPEEPKVNAWSLSTWGKGLSQVGKWLGYAWHAITLNRAAYGAIARDATMTAPALLITLISQTLQSLNSLERFDIVNILLRTVIWFVAILLLFFAGRILRGKADYTTTLRVTGFAQSAHILELLGFIPVIGPLARIMGLILTLLGVWMGTAQANEFSGWRSILLPVVYIATMAITIVFLMAVIEGTVFTVDGVLLNLGLIPDA